MIRASLIAQSVKNLPAMQETQVRSLGCEDPLDKALATHSSIFAWRITWTEEPGGPQSRGSLKSRTQLKQLSMRACAYIIITSHSKSESRPVVSDSL